MCCRLISCMPTSTQQISCKTGQHSMLQLKCAIVIYEPSNVQRHETVISTFNCIRMRLCTRQSIMMVYLSVIAFFHNHNSACCVLLQIFSGKNMVHRPVVEGSVRGIHSIFLNVTQNSFLQDQQFLIIEQPATYSNILSIYQAISLRYTKSADMCLRVIRDSWLRMLWVSNCDGDASQSSKSIYIFPRPLLKAITQFEYTGSLS